MMDTPYGSLEPSKEYPVNEQTEESRIIRDTTTVDYGSRAKKFAITSAIIALIATVLVFIPPLSSLWIAAPFSFAFSSLAYRSIAQAKQAGQDSGFAKYLAVLPIVGLIAVIAYITHALQTDTSGWASLGLLLMFSMMIPVIIISYLVVIFTNRNLKKKDADKNPIENPTGFMISGFRIGAIILLLPVLWIIYLWLSFIFYSG